MSSLRSSTQTIAAGTVGFRPRSAVLAAGDHHAAFAAMLAALNLNMPWLLSRAWRRCRSCNRSAGWRSCSGCRSRSTQSRSMDWSGQASRYPNWVRLELGDLQRRVRLRRWCRSEHRSWYRSCHPAGRPAWNALVPRHVDHRRVIAIVRHAVIVIQRRDSQAQIFAAGRLAADLAPRNLDLGEVALKDRALASCEGAGRRCAGRPIAQPQ